MFSRVNTVFIDVCKEFTILENNVYIHVYKVFFNEVEFTSLKITLHLSFLTFASQLPKCAIKRKQS